MKNLLLLFFLIVAIPALSQTHQIIVSSKFNIKTSTDVTLKPGDTGTIDLTDTSKVYLFIPTAGVTKITYTVPGGTTPPTPGATVIEAESTTSFSGLNTTGEPNVICCIQPGSYAAYPVNFTTAKTKLTVLYSRGSAGSGTVMLRTGSQTGPIIATLSFPTTGAWSGSNAFKTAIFTIPSQIGAKVLYFTNPNAGEYNPDKYTFE